MKGPLPASGEEEVVDTEDGEGPPCGKDDNGGTGGTIDGRADAVEDTGADNSMRACACAVRDNLV